MKKILKFFLFFVVICVACFCEIGGRVIAQSDSSKLRIAFIPQLIATGRLRLTRSTSKQPKIIKKIFKLLFFSYITFRL